jgi:hypothetical protein
MVNYPQVLTQEKGERKMPKVGNKEFDYTAQGLAEAKAEAEKTGQQMETTDASARSESYQLGGKIPGQPGFGERPQPVNPGMNPLGVEQVTPSVPIPPLYEKGGKVDRKAKREAKREARARKRAAEGKHVYSKKYRDKIEAEKKAKKVDASEKKKATKVKTKAKTKVKTKAKVKSEAKAKYDKSFKTPKAERSYLTPKEVTEKYSAENRKGELDYWKKKKFR